MSNTSLTIVGRLTDQFTMVSNDFARDPSIPPRAKALFIYLSSHADGWRLSINAAAKATGMGRNTIYKALDDLRSAGYVTRTQMVDEAGLFAGVEYRIHAQQLPAEERDTDASPRVPKSGKRAELGVSDVSAGGDRFPKNGIPKNGIPKNGTLKKNNIKKTNLQENQREEEAAVAATPPALSRGQFLPDGWEPPSDVVEKMRAERPDLDLWQEHLKFCDYWHSASGQNARKRDWVAAWRLWMRRQRGNPNAGLSSRQEGVQARSGTNPNDWLELMQGGEA